MPTALFKNSFSVYSQSDIKLEFGYQVWKGQENAVISGEVQTESLKHLGLRWPDLHFNVTEM